MISYIIQVILFQVLFLLVYDLFLSKETFFTKNRWYLLSTPVLSFLLPLIKIPTFKQAVPQDYIVYVPKVIMSPEIVIKEASWYQSINYVEVLFWGGVLVFSVVFLYKLFAIVRLIRTYTLVKKDGYTLVLIPQQTKAFSFFNYIFLGNQLPEAQKTQIIAHELVHSSQKHSLDLLFFEVLKIVMWFNPMLFIYQKRITLVHEYISDEVATKSAPKDNYINQLLSNFFQVENIPFINQFYKHTLIKKRIIMMTKHKSKKLNQLKYLILIPVLLGMLFYTSCTDSIEEELPSKLQAEMRYRNKDNKLVGTKSTRQSYLDSFIGLEPPIGATQIYLKDLNENEKAAYLEVKNNFKPTSTSLDAVINLYKLPNGRKTTALIVGLKKPKGTVETRVETKFIDGEAVEVIEENVNFMVIDTAPTFPGCNEADKDCFNKSVQKHFTKAFNNNLPNELGLESGRKRVFIGFKIDEEGNVNNVRARGPHPDIEAEVLRVMKSLPKMTPGSHKGDVVSVNYNIPFVLEVN